MAGPTPRVIGAGVISLLGAGAFVCRMRHTHDPLVPPALFREPREFTVTNLATVLLYAALGVSFFLVAYELQVAAGWSALRAGHRAASRHGAHVLVLGGVGFARPTHRAAVAADGRAAPRRGGPAAPSRIGPDTRLDRKTCCRARIVFGLGLVTFVAPLTATVMGSVDSDHVSVGIGCEQRHRPYGQPGRARGDPGRVGAVRRERRCRGDARVPASGSSSPPGSPRSPHR